MVVTKGHLLKYTDDSVKVQCRKSYFCSQISILESISRPIQITILSMQHTRGLSLIMSEENKITLQL